MTHIVFDGRHNGEGVTVTDAEPDYAPNGAELRVYTGLCGDGYLDAADVLTLRDALTKHLSGLANY